jgi:hypothetical protein
MPMPDLILLFGQPPRVWTGRLHDALVLVLIGLRPLIWSGDPTAFDNLAYLVLVVLGLVLLVAEGWAGARREWRWGWSGLLFALVVAALLPAAICSPLPSEGWGLWGMLTVHLGLAAYLMQVIPGRERLALGALGGALTVVCLVAMAQQAWVLPAMAEGLRQKDPGIARFETSQGNLAERIRNGGVYGPFTMANALAAYLLLAGPAFVALLFRRRFDRSGRILVLILSALVVAVFIGTASKGAALVGVVAGAAMWMALVPGWQRWLPLATIALVAGLAMTRPGLTEGLKASTETRLGYWQGAGVLIGEAPLAGQGLRAFAAHSPRAMPQWAEPSKFVHNEVLEAAVDGGVIAAVLLVLLLLRLPATPPLGIVQTEETPDNHWRFAPLAFLILVPFFCALGMLSSNLGWWPGARGEAGLLGWFLVVAVVMIGTTVWCLRLPQPPAWAWRLALGAFALHCLIDFDLHSPGLWGTAIVVACLAGQGGAPLPVNRWHWAAASVAVLVLAGGLVFGSKRAVEIQSGYDLFNQVNDCRAALGTKAEAVDGEFKRLAGLLDQPFPATGIAKDRAARDFMDQAARERVAALSLAWPRCTPLDFTAVALWPPGSKRRPLSQELSARQPFSAGAHELLANDLIAIGAWDDAIAERREAVRLAPAKLERRLDLAYLLDLAAAKTPSREAELRVDAKRVREEVERLRSIVHVSNRP